MRQLDVRDLMARGEEPFAVIMEAVAQLGPEEAFELTAPLEPVPLYGVLDARGFQHETEDLGGGDYRVLFTRNSVGDG
ncbi:MAG: DUF2249 domain-containing protein [Candidatus Dormibacteria bacterium]